MLHAYLATDPDDLLSGIGPAGNLTDGPSVATLRCMAVPGAGSAALETGVIYCDDNLARLRKMPSESVDLIYLDPPFFSEKDYEVIWGDAAERRSFDDRWEGGIQVYIAWMRERVQEMHRILKPTGSIYLHCDWHASHHLRVMLDGIFGASQFLNEVVWAYRGGGVSKRHWGRKHDTIFLYAKGKGWTFNPQYTPYSDFTLARTAKTGLRPNRTKIDVDRGAHMPDWWVDLNALQTWSPERIGYPTQKPVALLERIIAASSNPGDVVLDPFCGCGTTLVAAHQQGREWIGIDVSPTAAELMKRRLDRLGATARLVGMPVTENELRGIKPFEFQNWVVQRFNGTHSPRKTGDMGIDGFSWFEHLPIQVKQSDAVGREIVDKFETAIDRNGNKAGYIVAFSFTRGAREEVARVRNAKGLDIRLTRVADLLAGDRPPDAPDASPPEVAPLVDRIRRGLAETIEAESASPEGPQSLPATKRGRPLPQPSQGSGDTD